ncbi:hypothetical protein MBLNU457_4778t1 [Dothideomycetes sp. NU457]
MSTKIAKDVTPHKKLPRLPQTHRVQKRPLLRPSIPSKYAGPSSQKVVYISTKTPFMSAVKRVQKLLQQADKRNTQAVAAQVKQSRRKQGRGGKGKGDETEEVAARLAEGKGGEAEAREVVLVKGTGRAVAKALEVGLWFQQRDEYGVQVRTGSVGAVDDIVEKDGAEEPVLGNGDDDMDLDASTVTGDNGQQHDDDKEEEEIPETRIRYTSVVEIGVSLIR